MVISVLQPKLHTQHTSSPWFLQSNLTRQRSHYCLMDTLTFVTLLTCSCTMGHLRGGCSLNSQLEFLSELQLYYWLFSVQHGTVHLCTSLCSTAFTSQIQTDGEVGAKCLPRQFSILLFVTMTTTARSCYWCLHIASPCFLSKNSPGRLCSCWMIPWHISGTDVLFHLPPWLCNYIRQCRDQWNAALIGLIMIYTTVVTTPVFMSLGLLSDYRKTHFFYATLTSTIPLDYASFPDALVTLRCRARWGQSDCLCQQSLCYDTKCAAVSPSTTPIPSTKEKKRGGGLVEGWSVLGGIK